jgi:ribonuclease HI
MDDVSWKLFVDGAARNNPGPAGAGIVIVRNDVVVIKEGFFLGVKTNNQAEYLALLFGILLLKRDWRKGEKVTVFSDSQLLVLQVIGRYKVRHAHLLQLHRLGVILVADIGATVEHIMRENNKEADGMANYGIDCAVQIPQLFVRFLYDHNIIL